MNLAQEDGMLILGGKEGMQLAVHCQFLKGGTAIQMHIQCMGISHTMPLPSGKWVCGIMHSYGEGIAGLCGDLNFHILLPRGRVTPLHNTLTARILVRAPSSDIW